LVRDVQNMRLFVYGMKYNIDDSRFVKKLNIAVAKGWPQITDSFRIIVVGVFRIIDLDKEVK